MTVPRFEAVPHTRIEKASDDEGLFRIEEDLFMISSFFFISGLGAIAPFFKNLSCSKLFSHAARF